MTGAQDSNAVVAPLPRRAARNACALAPAASYHAGGCSATGQQHGPQVLHKPLLPGRAEQDAAMAKVRVVHHLEVGGSRLGVRWARPPDVGGVLGRKSGGTAGGGWRTRCARACGVVGVKAGAGRCRQGLALPARKACRPLARRPQTVWPPPGGPRPVAPHLRGVSCQLDVCHDQLRGHQVIPPRQHHQAAQAGQAQSGVGGWMSGGGGGGCWVAWGGVGARPNGRGAGVRGPRRCAFPRQQPRGTPSSAE